MIIDRDPTAATLKSLLDATALRQKVLSNNLANSDTPGFIRQDVEFEQQLSDAVQRGDVPNVKPEVVEDNQSPARADGNNVSVEHELSEMSKNAMVQQFAIQMMQTKLSIARSAITGRS
jgi:flagellar basal-body rod protein FlgB